MILNGNGLIQESGGVVDLKIARLERHLRRLEQQQALGSGYPGFKARLIQKKLHLQIQLQQLLQFRAVE